MEVLRTLSVTILTQILWNGNFFEFEIFYFSIFTELYVNMCFNCAIFVNVSEDKSLYLQ
jgi:hypothetical protein